MTLQATLQARPALIVILDLVSSALLAGMIILSMSVGSKRLINRRFAVLLLINLVGNLLGMFIWSSSVFGIELSATIYQIFGKLLGVGIVLGSYVGFVFTETLLGKQRWSERFRLILGVIGLMLSIVVLLPINFSTVVPADLANAGPPSPATLMAALYSTVCGIGSVILLWERRTQLPHPLFGSGLALLALAAVLLPMQGIIGTALPLVIDTVATILISVAILRQQVLNPLAQERAEIAEERDHLLHIHEAVQAMLDETTLQSRLRVAVKALSSLGWGMVSVILRGQNLTITEPSGPAGTASTPAEEVWLKWWQGPAEALEKHRLGIGYFFPHSDSAPHEADARAWQLGDLLILPLTILDGQLDALIILSDPQDHKRPDEAQLRPLGIIAAQTRSIVENNSLLDELQNVLTELQEQVEELTMMQRVDKELSATLNFDSVMMLTMDWALRRTGATAGMLNMLSPDGLALIPVASLGYPIEFSSHYGPHNPLPLSRGIMAEAVRSSKTQIAHDTKKEQGYDPLLPTTRSEVAVPMEIRGRVLGVLNLESDMPDAFSPAHMSFIQRLASRAVVAMDNARLYREAEGRADEMAALYSAGRSMSGSLERADVLRNTAQALAAVMNVSSTVMADYRADRRELTVSSVYRLGSMRQITDVLLPPIGFVYYLDALPEIQSALKAQRIFEIRASDTNLSAALREFATNFKCQSILVAPLVSQGEVIAVALVIDGRRSRAFSQDEMLMVESVASQGASALRQALLYEDVRELEKVKSDMIRMASHDLRNPLGNAIGYFDVLLSTMPDLSETQQEYIEYIRHSTNNMKTLIDDLLTLERVESERQSSWKNVDFTELVKDTVAAQQSAAELKQQILTLRILPSDDADYNVFGSATQLRQAVANLVNNASKYTPDGGTIAVTLAPQESRLIFEVKDNGYGISKERQERLFQRFYRAKEVATEHIPGTGLGLSLVKTVVDRHGGEVWVRSELGQGSTFAFSLPISEVREETPAGMSEGHSLDK